MTKYRTENIMWGVNPTIVPVEIERESGASLWINGKRVAKQSNRQAYHDTWEEAHAYLLENALQQVDECGKKLERAKGRLTNVTMMIKPA